MSIEKIDVKGKMCPMPVALTKRKLAELQPGQMLEVVGEGGLEFDNIQRWLNNNGQEIVEAQKTDGEFRLLVKKV